MATRLSSQGISPDPDAIHAAREALARQIAEAHQAQLSGLYDAMTVAGPYRPDAADAAQSVVLEQVSGGLAIRMAVLYHLLAGDTRGGIA